MSTKKIKKNYQLGRDYQRVAMWTILKTCNFNCEYCFYNDSQAGLIKKTARKILKKIPSLDPFNYEKITSEQAEKFFNSTAKRWYLIITGGEPFIYPNFIDILAKITKKHLVTICTNLSLTEKLQSEFFQKVNPKNVKDIYASLHLAERERIGLSLDEFIQKAKLFQKKGFRVITDYVLYPPYIKRFKEINNRFQKEGLTLEAKVFKGLYQGKKYPESFTPKERKQFFNHIQDPIERIYSFKIPSFTEIHCSAGLNFFRITPNGLITRCPSDWETVGNLAKNKFNPYKKIKPCQVKYCDCPIASTEKCVDINKRINKEETSLEALIGSQD
ncbi:MAG: 4Fe-4S cluster-binding domain-containing protein [Candidatus Moranbacteria bacterium]|nr:4Fe-4S cluster-binding domain-containing protein [Candidatus Moranbacteria bacterium]